MESSAVLPRPASSDFCTHEIMCAKFARQRSGPRPDSGIHVTVNTFKQISEVPSSLGSDLNRTSIDDKYSGSEKINTYLDHMSHLVQIGRTDELTEYLY